MSPNGTMSLSIMFTFEGTLPTATDDDSDDRDDDSDGVSATQF